MATAAELLNRRIGRMEALAFDLSQVKPGYQPTELELMRARELQAVLARVFAIETKTVGDIEPLTDEIKIIGGENKPSKKQTDKK